MVPWLVVTSRDAPKRIDRQILRVRLIAAFDAGLVRQSTRLECNVRCQGARSGQIVELHGEASVSEAAGADPTFDACGIFIE